MGHFQVTLQHRTPSITNKFLSLQDSTETSPNRAEPRQPRPALHVSRPVQNQERRSSFLTSFLTSLVLLPPHLELE